MYLFVYMSKGCEDVCIMNCKFIFAHINTDTYTITHTHTHTHTHTLACPPPQALMPAEEWNAKVEFLTPKPKPPSPEPPLTSR